jgi:hypothetical protein
MAGDTTLDLLKAFFENKIFEDSNVGYWLLTTTITKIVLYAFFAWLMIFRNEFVRSKFFRHKVFQQEDKSIRDLSYRDLMFLLFKLAGFIFITQEFILLFTSGFTYIGIAQIEENYNWILLRNILFHTSYKVLILILGLLMFCFTDTLMKWIKE